MTPRKKVYKKNIIGKTIEVINSNNKSLIGIKGMVENETKNMIIINSNNRIKKIIKNTVIVKIEDEIVDGKSLIGTIDERLKK